MPFRFNGKSIIVTAAGSLCSCVARKTRRSPELNRGKVVIITGSSNGIGRATAVLFSREGARVVITGRSLPALAETKAQCLAAGASALDILELPGNLEDDKYLEHLVQQTIQKFGKLDILINNAASVIMHPTMAGFDQPVEIFDTNWRINTRPMFKLIQLCYPHLQKTKGDIVNVSSFLALPPHGICSMPYYAICKAANDHMSRAMAQEYIKKGVRVNMIHPGLIHTNFFQKLGPSDEKVAEMEDFVCSKPSFVPKGRVGQPEDIANAIAFMADRSVSDYIVGQTIVVDGGASMCFGCDTSDYKLAMA